jgi:hypothetical protein
MLARMWNGPEATSVWDELVTKRKEEIGQEVERAVYPSKFDADVCASTQELTRDELARWDASARSWIESADKAKVRQHKQLILMLDNINVPVNSEKSVYSSVMAAWSTALVAMDCLVRGIPQQVQDAAALLGMSSWHLYPDLVILGTVTAEVKQGDQLFLPTALLTLGLQFADKSHSVSWSLPLAHMRYYGHPVWSQRALGQENSRISMDEFAYIVLGAVFGGWMEYGRSTDEGLSWLLKLMRLLDKFSQSTKEQCFTEELLPNFDVTQKRRGKIFHFIYEHAKSQILPHGWGGSSLQLSGSRIARELKGKRQCSWLLSAAAAPRCCVPVTIAHPRCLAYQTHSF